MDNNHLIQILKRKIFDSLSSVIGDKVILTDLPYHGNIGDILIWEGERIFLNECRINLISQTSSSTFTFPKIDEDITICLHGGGNFGDLYREAQLFRRKVISNYPNNKIIIFPQSVWYNDIDLISKDSEEFSKHNNLYICARDFSSYRFLKEHFGNNHIILVPDMAFCIGEIDKAMHSIGNKNPNLFIKRLDKELLSGSYDIPSNTDIRDWPFFEGNDKGLRYLLGLQRRILKINSSYIKQSFNKQIDKLMNNYFRGHLINEGINMLLPYDTVYTTRLHAMILSILMNKKVVAFDNNTKKLSDYADTWLREGQMVTLNKIKE